MGRLHRSYLVVPAVGAEHTEIAVVLLQAVEVIPVQAEPVADK